MDTSSAIRLGLHERRFGYFFNDNHCLREVGNPHELKDPSTGREWASVHVSPEALEEVMNASKEAVELGEWAACSDVARSRLLLRLADLVEENVDELAALEMMSAGKLLQTTQREVLRVAAWYRYFSGISENLDGRSISIGTVEARTSYEPVGVVAVITPFNASLSLGTWSIAPALAVGNVVVVKPPIDAPGSMLLLAELATEAGFPKSVFNVLPGGADTGAALVKHSSVDMVSFTGSSAVAASVGAATAETFKKFACEAGGKSAHIVFDDSDLDSALISVKSGVFSNAGQSCVAGSRVLVQADSYEGFVERVVAGALQLKVGDPMDPNSHLGPVSTEQQFARVSNLVEEAVRQGARVLAGGGPPNGLDENLAEGYFYSPTVLTGVTPEMEIWNEEVFGPVMIIQEFHDEAEAIDLANHSHYGLAAGIWTSDSARARRVASSLDAGTVWVNTYRFMDYRIPFGGYKQSGVGRLNGREAVYEFTNTKSIVQGFAPAVDPFK